MSPAPALDQRAQRLTALQATALALQSRLQSHALRLSGAKEGAIPQPAASTQPMETDFGFQGVLPGLNPCFVVYVGLIKRYGPFPLKEHFPRKENFVKCDWPAQISVGKKNF